MPVTDERFSMGEASTEVSTGAAKAKEAKAPKSKEVMRTILTGDGLSGGRG